MMRHRLLSYGARSAHALHLERSLSSSYSTSSSSAASGQGTNTAFKTNNPRILESQVRAKIRRGEERSTRQGPDPAADFKNGWRLASSVILERYPVLIPDETPAERAWHAACFEAQQADSIPVDNEFFLTERDRLEGRSVPDFTDPVSEQYRPAPRDLKGDTGNRKSLNKYLDERLYFVVRNKKKDQKLYHFPQLLLGEQNADVTLWNAAKKALFNSALMPDRTQQQNVHFINPRPATHLEHVFSPAYQKAHDVYGVKIFFYRAVLLNPFDYIHGPSGSSEFTLAGHEKDGPSSLDFAWMSENELLHDNVLEPRYAAAIRPALYGVAV